MSKKNKYYRHGDVTVEQLPTLPEKYKSFKSVKVNKATLALGEITGHHHCVIPVDDSVITMYSENGEKPSAEEQDLVLHVNGKGLLIHEEHEPIMLETGFYWRGIKKQFNPFTNTTENVKD